MLFSYPAPGGGNGFHKCMAEAPSSASTCGRPRFPAWPGIASVAYHPAQAQDLARDALKVLRYAEKLLSGTRPPLKAFVEQNKIETLLARNIECEFISKLPGEIQKPSRII